MATLQGNYAPVRVAPQPRSIDVTATPDEFDRIGPLPTTHPGWLDNPPDTVNIPADRALVKQIAKRVEVQCEDQELIDWMKGA